jgi:hypothetical protein
MISLTNLLAITATKQRQTHRTLITPQGARAKAIILTRTTESRTRHSNPNQSNKTMTNQANYFKLHFSAEDVITFVKTDVNSKSINTLFSERVGQPATASEDF